MRVRVGCEIPNPQLITHPHNPFMDGILLFNKPIFWTSHDAVDFVRRRVGQRAVGHAGTLDPLATGLLVILLGRSTKLSQKFSQWGKDYSGMLTLGLTTDTQDL